MSQPRVNDLYDVERWGYDPGSKIWTFVTGLLLAGIVDWFAVVMPVRNHPPHGLHMTGWSVALIIALISPVSWLVGRIIKKDWNGVVIWVVVTALAVIFQLVVVVWGRNY